MTTLRTIRRKIQSVSNIEKITKAMELVAASRLLKAQSKAESSRPYAIKLKEILNQLIIASDDFEHPFIMPRTVKKRGVIIIGADRGLCGSYNQNVFTAAEKFLRQYEEYQVELIPIGRKSVEYFSRKQWPILTEIAEWGGKITYSEIEAFTKLLINFYLQKELDEIWLVYTHFVNMATRQVRIEKFLSIDPEVASHSTDSTKTNYLFEPDAPTILAEALPQYCITKIQSALNDAYASELASRICSMRAATKNAGELIEKLILIRNKVRQSGITRELIEITSGAENVR